MNTYNNPVFLINWQGGSCGAFITSLTYLFLNNTITQNFSKYGNAHNSSLPECMMYWNIADTQEYLKNHLHKTPIYDIVAPKKIIPFFILYDHIPPDHDKLFEKYPNCTNIIVTIDQSMNSRVYINLFFKTIVEEFPNSKGTWEMLRKKYSYFTEFEDPRDLPLNVIETHFKSLHAPKRNPYSKCYRDGYAPPEKYKDKIVSIKMHDIIHNSNIVLEQLSTATNKPITDNIRAFYEAYLIKQEELIQANVPWLDDK